MNAPLATGSERSWAVIPVKSFARAKSRLAPVLAAPERRALARSLFERVLRACLDCGAFERVLVATDGDDVALACAGRPRVAVLCDPSPREPLAKIARRALEHAHASGAKRAVLVMSDLPAVRAADLAELHAWLAFAVVALAPDRTRRGVGALATTLPCAFEIELGHRDSLERNLRAAHAAGVRVQVTSQPRLASDVDTALDLEHAL